MTMGRQTLRPPRRLRAGDRVAVVAPSGGPVPKDRLDAGCEIIRRWGLEVVIAAHATDRHERLEYLAGSDADRAADFQAAWCDRSISAVICARGGYGVQRIIELLDWSAMAAAEPKALVGYSDITALHSAVATQLGVVTLHGPMVSSAQFIDDARTAHLLRQTLFEPQSARVLTSSTAHTLIAGRARGVTIGGCLSLLASELGTSTGLPSAAGAIVLLEDLGERAYRIDGYLTHLLRAGWFADVAGVVLGSWKDCEPVDELMRDRLGPLGVPIIAELGFGHGDSALTVPLGVPAVMDADAATLTLDLPALV
jgi:muramoyltetrapeptide carboxypeptidase